MVPYKWKTIQYKWILYNSDGNYKNYFKKIIKTFIQVPNFILNKLMFFIFYLNGQTTNIYLFFWITYIVTPQNICFMFVSNLKQQNNIFFLKIGRDKENTQLENVSDVFLNKNLFVQSQNMPCKALYLRIKEPLVCKWKILSLY